MKRLLLIVLLLFGCGQDQSNDFADISMVTITWQGYLDEYPNPDPALMQKFETTSTCVDSFGYQRDGYPYIKLVSGPFTCGEFTNRQGCMVFHENTIYVTGSVLWVDPNMFIHEAVHWISSLDNSAHDSDLFKQCSIY